MAMEVTLAGVVGTGVVAVTVEVAVTGVVGTGMVAVTLKVAVVGVVTLEVAVAGEVPVGSGSPPSRPIPSTQSSSLWNCLCTQLTTQGSCSAFFSSGRFFPSRFFTSVTLSFCKTHTPQPLSSPSQLHMLC